VSNRQNVSALLTERERRIAAGTTWQNPLPYAERVQQLEVEGLTTSDAQGVADVEVQRGLILPD
jgi:hypothetical protein